MRRPAGWRLMLGLGLAAALALPAAAAPAFERPMRAEWEPGRLLVTASIPELLTPELREDLASGFTVRIRLAVEVVELGATGRRGRADSASAVRYLIWDEQYLIEDWPPLAGRAYERDAAALAERLGELRRLAVPMPLGRPPEAVRIEIRAAVSPITGEEEERLRGWAAPPAAAGGDPGGLLSFVTRNVFVVGSRPAAGELTWRSPATPVSVRPAAPTRPSPSAGDAPERR